MKKQPIDRTKSSDFWAMVRAKVDSWKGEMQAEADARRIEITERVVEV